MVGLRSLRDLVPPYYNWPTAGLAVVLVRMVKRLARPLGRSYNRAAYLTTTHLF